MSGNGQEESEEDYYLLPDGRLVMTASFLLKRGYCCGNGCRNCPYDYENVPEHRRSDLLRQRNEDISGQITPSKGMGKGSHPK
ncbi:MAG TPA: DUF5522 domain-containing protein [Flavipsychrobacter sp.]|nr:DUF5522 domain-containing protein [Flavipsychrobacter sp.]